MFTLQSLRGLWSKPLTATSSFLSCVAMSTNIINAYVYNILITLCITQQPYLLLTSVHFRGVSLQLYVPTLFSEVDKHNVWNSGAYFPLTFVP